MNTIIKLPFLFFLQFTAMHAQCKNEPFLFSKNDQLNTVMLLDEQKMIYTEKGGFHFEEKQTELNNYTYDLFVDGNLIGRYYYDSDFNLLGADLHIENKKLAKKIGFVSNHLTIIEENMLCVKADDMIRNKTSVNALNNRAFVLMNQKYYEAAILLLNAVIETAPERVVAYINRGDCLWETNNKEKATEDYKVYIELMKSKERI